MAKYKVITIALGVKNNRIAKFGEIVDTSELTIDASELIGKSIELYEGNYEKISEDVESGDVEEKPILKKDEVKNSFKKK